MPQRLPSIALAALCSAAALTAQSLVHVPDDSLQDRSINFIPFGSHEAAGTYVTQRYQTLVPGPFLGNETRAIQEIGFAPAAPGRHVFDRITVRMTQTHIQQLDPSFAQNLGSAARLVLDARDYHWHHEAGTWSRIGLERAFVFDPSAGNVLVDIEVRGARSLGGLSEAGFYRADDVQRVYAITTANGTLPGTGKLSTGGLMLQIVFELATTGRFGEGCLGSNGKRPAHEYTGLPKLGTTVHAELHDVPAGTATVMLLGASIDVSFFPLPLPSAGDCRLHTFPLTMTALPTATPKTSLPLPIPPSPGLRGLRFYTQFVTLDLAANATGLTTSNYVRILVGS